MAINTHQGSAKIYQFPMNSRKTNAERRKIPEALVQNMNQRVSDVVLGDCWYHDAAVKQSAGFTKP